MSMLLHVQVSTPSRPQLTRYGIASNDTKPLHVQLVWIPSSFGYPWPSPDKQMEPRGYTMQQTGATDDRRETAVICAKRALHTRVVALARLPLAPLRLRERPSRLKVVAKEGTSRGGSDQPGSGMARARPPSPNPHAR